MSTFDAPENKREIIIVRRGRGDEEEGRHGGVWKIAFADFMTAMMCFFLVMWLVNASSEQTKSAIASYFNPMRLVDTTPSRKGLEEPGETSSSRQDRSPPVESQGEDKGAGAQERDGTYQPTNSRAREETHKTSDERLFSDPYAVLAEIAAQTATLQNVSDKGDGGAQDSGPASGAQGGESYRDPFAPDFWSQEVASAEQDAELDVFRQPAQEMAQETDAATATDREPAGEVSDGQIDGGQKADAPDLPPAPDEALIHARQVAEQVRADIAEAFGRDSDLNKAVSVTVEKGGVLISVTEEFDFGMFEVGSAVPKRELVLAMEKIGHMLNGHAGRIRINGHTDGRPFRNDSYDNWRLSAARAHSAYYMLVRAGIDEMRIKEVAGFADRELKLADDPLASVNRRIEIFLETEG